MKTSKAGLIFICGAALGLSLALCLGAADKALENPKPDWSRLKIITYSSGITGFFDPDTGKLYIYDVKLERCAFVRELKTLGQPLIWR